jgi:hypothetical protein
VKIQQRFTELLDEKIQTLKERGDWNLPTESKFTILGFGAKNLLSFKEIELNLNDYKGITVVYADNGVGKTHINRLITYLLFGEFYKKDERQMHKDAFNWYVDIGNASGWIKIELDGKTYLIERNLVKNKKGDVSHTLQINQINEKGESLLDLTPKKVEKDKQNKSNLDEFTDKLGTVKDFLFTSFFDSFNLEKWVDDGQAAVNERIFRYQGLESLVKIQKLAKEDYKAFVNNSRYLNISKDAVNTEIAEIEKQLLENSSNIGVNKQLIADLEFNVTDLDNQILLNHKKIKAVGEGLANYDLYKNEQNLTLFKKQLSDLQLRYTELLEKQKTFDVNVDFTEIESKRNNFSNSLK